MFKSNNVTVKLNQAVFDAWVKKHGTVTVIAMAFNMGLALNVSEQAWNSKRTTGIQYEQTRDSKHTDFG